MSLSSNFSKTENCQIIVESGRWMCGGLQNLDTVPRSPTMKRQNQINVLIIVSFLAIAATGFLGGHRCIRHQKQAHTVSIARVGALEAVSQTQNEAVAGAQQRGGVNSGVRNIMSLLHSRYGSGGNSSWTKTRNYIYHTSNSLTINQVEDVLLFLDSILPKDTHRDIIQASPRILRKNVKRYLQPTAVFLLDLWGPEMFREALTRNPDLLLSIGVGSKGSNNDEVKLFLKDSLGLKPKALEKLQRTAPFVFSLSSEKLRSVIAFLRGILEKGSFSSNIIREVLEKLVTSHPTLLNLSVETKLEPRVQFLMSRCGLNENDMAALIKSSGTSVLGLSVEDNLRPTIDYLASIVNHDNEALRKCVMTHPQLLGLSLKNLQTKVAYFKSIDSSRNRGASASDVMNAVSPSLALRIALKSPAVYSLSLNRNIIPTVEFLARVWGTRAPVLHEASTIIGSNSENGEASAQQDYGLCLGSLLSEYPNLLTCSLEGNIQPTMNFFNRTGYTALTGNWELVKGKGSVAIIRGRHIAASLYNRLLPRWHYCMSKGTKEIDGSPKTPPLHILVVATDQAFCTHFSFDMKDFLAFKADAIPRLKFSSQFDTWLKTGRPIDI
jgi:hypothetical protein